MEKDTKKKETVKADVESVSKEETIEVSKDFLKEIKSEIDSLKSDNRMLIQIADKKSLSTWQARNKKDLPHEVKIRAMMVEQKEGEMPVEKVVVGWKTTEDIVEYDPVAKKGYESQKVMLLFEDNTKKEYSLGNFNKNFKYIDCKRLGQIVDEATGNVAFKLIRIDNGKEYTLGVQFVN